MRLAQSENGSDLGNCCETVTQFISQSRSCFGTMRGHETGAGNLAGGRCFVSNDALDGNLARSARPSRRHNRPKRDTCPFDEGDDPCVFCPKREESMNGEKISCWPQFS